MIVLGIDPGPNLHGYCLLSGTRILAAGEALAASLYSLRLFHNLPVAVVVERPRTIMELHINMDSTIWHAAILTHEFAKLLPTHTPPREAIVGQLGYPGKGNRDKWLAAHLPTLGFSPKFCKSSHLCAAAACALFNVKMNQQYLYTGSAA